MLATINSFEIFKWLFASPNKYLMIFLTIFTDYSLLDQRPWFPRTSRIIQTHNEFPIAVSYKTYYRSSYEFSYTHQDAANINPEITRTAIAHAFRMSSTRPHISSPRYRTLTCPVPFPGIRLKDSFVSVSLFTPFKVWFKGSNMIGTYSKLSIQRWNLYLGAMRTLQRHLHSDLQTQPVLLFRFL